ncbi:hypothetical protein ZIOFF_006367 [Zingiber officinale]|uniref:Uncharacterized protein n=1 Tax=Zingiber officinale TaxID=94328 RepID=A0A8J5I2K2_ZINOF|nr:hypothetical protein ZIOFF_006367 [Zingiber officinale]
MKKTHLHGFVFSVSSSQCMISYNCDDVQKSREAARSQLSWRLCVGRDGYQVYCMMARPTRRRRKVKTERCGVASGKPEATWDSHVAVTETSGPAWIRCPGVTDNIYIYIIQALEVDKWLLIYRMRYFIHFSLSIVIYLLSSVCWSSDLLPHGYESHCISIFILETSHTMSIIKPHQLHPPSASSTFSFLPKNHCRHRRDILIGSALAASQLDSLPREVWEDTELRLMATAGLRLLNTSVVNRILESCRKVLRSYDFRFQNDWASVISGSLWLSSFLLGSDEGIYAWVSATGIFELGGASAQVCINSVSIVLDQIVFTNQVGNVMLDWALGAFIVRQALQPRIETSDQVAAVFHNESWSWLSSIVASILLILTAWFLLLWLNPKLKNIWLRERPLYTDSG